MENKFVFLLTVMANLLAYLELVSGGCDKRFQIVTGHSACKTASPNLVSSGLDAGDQDLILQLHNDYRRAVEPPATNMLKMSWDAETAAVAQAWADTCIYDHESVSYLRIIPGRYDLGQNLAKHVTKMSWTTATGIWHNEVNNFEYGTGSTGGEILHYTQIVWATTTKIGCGYAHCSNIGHLYVCNYAPAGNWYDSVNTPYVSGTRCSACPSSCVNGLCDCAHQDCMNRGTQNPDTCACECIAKDFYVGNNCALNCTNIGTPSCVHNTGDCQVYGNVPFECPVLCGWCPDGDSTVSDDGGDSGAVTVSLKSYVPLLCFVVVCTLLQY